MRMVDGGHNLRSKGGGSYADLNVEEDLSNLPSNSNMEVFSNISKL